MAKLGVTRDDDSITAFILSNENVVMQDPFTGAIVFDKGALSSLRSDYKSILRAGQSATSESDFFSKGEIQVADDGKGHVVLYAPKAKAQQVKDAMTSQIAKLKSMAGREEQHRYSITEAPATMLSATKTLKGKPAQKQGLADVSFYGGVTEHLGNIESESYAISLPMLTSEADALGTKGISDYVSKTVLGKASGLSATEQRRRTGIERANVQKEVDKALAEDEARAKKEKANKDKELAAQEAKEKKQARKFEDVLSKEAHRQTEGTDEEEEGGKSKRKMSFLGRAFLIMRIISLVTAAVDILRRILTATLKNASLVQSDAVKANSLGMSYSQIRELNRRDMAHGLKEGTTVGAIEAIQSKFGDVTNIDEKALGVLARVMGSDVADMVLSGMGGKTPDVLLNKILDSFLTQLRQGKNSLGQDVGQAQALRELTTVLKGVSPEIAEIFSRAGSEMLRGIYADAFSNMEEYNKLTKDYKDGLSEIDLERVKELGQVTDQLSSKFENLKDNVLDKLILSMDGLINWANNLNIGKSKSEIIDDITENRQKNVRARNLMLQGADIELSRAKAEMQKSGISFTDLGYASEKDFIENISDDLKKNLWTKGGKRAIKVKRMFREAGIDISLFLSYKRAADKATEQLESTAPKWNPTDFTQATVAHEAVGAFDASGVVSYEESVSEEARSMAFNAWLKSRFNTQTLDMAQLQSQKKLTLDERNDISALGIALSSIAKEKGLKDLVSLTSAPSGGLHVAQSDYMSIQEAYEYLRKSGVSDAAIMGRWRTKSARGFTGSKTVEDLIKAAEEKVAAGKEQMYFYESYANLAVSDFLARGYTLASNEVKVSAEKNKGVTVTLQLQDKQGNKVANNVSFLVDVPEDVSFIRTVGNDNEIGRDFANMQ